MEFTLEYHDGIFEVTTSGDANLQGYYDYVEAVLKHSEWKPGGLALTNHSKLNAGPLTMYDIETIAKVMEQYREQIGTAKIAVVAGNPLVYGLSRAWQTYVEFHQVWNASEELFWNREEALAWLKKE